MKRSATVPGSARPSGRPRRGRALLRLDRLACLACLACLAACSAKPPSFSAEASKDYDIVYSLPDPASGDYDDLRSYFEGAAKSGRFKSSRNVAKLRGRPASRRLAIFGTPKSNRLVQEELRYLGVDIEADSISYGGRSYGMDSFDFCALYRRGSQTIALMTGPSFAAIEGGDMSPPENGGYRLRNSGSLIVEEGSVGGLSAGSRLKAAASHPERAFTRARALQDLLDATRDSWVIPAAADDFSFIDGLAAGKKLLFLGEEHYKAEIQRAEAGIALRCAAKSGYRVLGTESLYSLWPYYEAASRGAQDSLPEAYREAASDSGGILADAVFEWDKGKGEGQALLLTAIDIDHAINHTKPLTEAYLRYLASLSSAASGREALDSAASGLGSKRSLAEVDSYLDGFDAAFRREAGSFAPKDREEIAFSLGLERASIRYQLLDPALSGSAEGEETRGAYFRKVIERAFGKAEARGGALICVVGGAHAILNDFAKGDYPVGKVSEARYFAREYARTAGRVASICILRLEGGAMGDPLFAAAQAVMGESTSVYLDMRAIKLPAGNSGPGAELALSLSSYFAGTEPKYDAILFVRMAR